jgi:hypothetical protein
MAGNGVVAGAKWAKEVRKWIWGTHLGKLQGERYFNLVGCELVEEAAKSPASAVYIMEAGRRGGTQIQGILFSSFSRDTGGKRRIKCLAKPRALRTKRTNLYRRRRSCKI